MKRISLKNRRLGSAILIAIVLALTLAAILQRPAALNAQGSSYYVASDGSDDTGDGSTAQPWASIAHALANVPDGSTILVRAGTYTGRIQLEGNFAQGVVVRAEEPFRAVLRNNDRVITTYGGCRGVTLEGFDIAHDGAGAGGLVIHIDGGGTAAHTSRLTLRNNVLHDSYNNDILKINNNAQDILVEGNIFYNQHGSDEHIDANSVVSVTIQDNIFFNDFAGSGRTDSDTSSFIVIKDSNGDSDGQVSSEHVKVRRNIFAHWEGSSSQGFVHAGEDGTANYEARDVLIENNLMLGNNTQQIRSPFQLMGVFSITVRANTVTGNMPAKEFGARIFAYGDNQNNDQIHLHNNIWSDPSGTMGDTFNRGNRTNTLTFDNNLFWNAGNAFPTSSESLIEVSDDPGRIEGDPLLGSQSGLVVPRWDPTSGQFADGSATIRQAFERLVTHYGTPGTSSPAIDAADPNHSPGEDILGTPRPSGGQADVGALEVLQSGPQLTLFGVPADQAIHLSWTLDGTLPVTATWQINYEDDDGTTYTPVSGIISPTRAHTLSSLTNDVWHTVTLSARLGTTPILSDSIRVLPTDKFVYLPVVSIAGASSTKTALPNTEIAAAPASSAEENDALRSSIPPAEPPADLKDVSDYTQTVYIDPSVSTPGDGSSPASPLDAWSAVSFQADTAYVQKRGTTATILSPLDVNRENVLLGAYGSQNDPRPIIHGNVDVSTSNKHLVNVSSSYVTVRDLEVRSAEATSGIRFTNWTEQPVGGVVWNCVVHGIDQSNYLVWGIRIFAPQTRVLNNEIYYIGDDGIFIQNASAVEIGYNHITRVNQKWFEDPSESHSGGDSVQYDGAIDGFHIHHNYADRSDTGNKFCFIANTDRGGIEGLIENNVCLTAKGRVPVYLNQYSGTPNDYHVIVRNNVFEYVGGDDEGIGVYNHAAYPEIYNNVFINFRQAIALISPTVLAQIHHNVFYNTLENGVWGNHPINAHNNIFALSPEATAFASTSNVTASHNLFIRAEQVAGENAIVGDPQFVNAANHDFHLQATSAAINAGIGVANIDTDADGNTRDTHPDLGAYEFQPQLTLFGTPADQAIHLNWTVNVTLPVTATWQIDYEDDDGTTYTPVSGIISPTRAHTLNGLTNGVWHTVTLSARLGTTPILSDTVRVLPTNKFVYLPVILK